jgi:cell volume regulation protein A
MEPLPTGILVAAIGLLLALAVVASPVFQRLGVPSLILFIVLGIAAGSEGIFGLPFDDYALAFRLGVIALVLILFDGGLNTSVTVFRDALLPAAVLATVGVLLTAAIVAGFGVVLGLSLPIAFLIGSVVSSTDAAAVFSVLRGSGIQLKQRTGAILEVESGLNDPMAVFLTVVTTEVVLGTQELGLDTAILLGQQLVIGGGFGFLLGRAGSALLRNVHLPVAGLYPVLTVGIAFIAFGLPTLAGGSGFLGVYIAAILLASRPLPYRAGVLRVHDALAWLAQILMFAMLGLLVFPSRLWPAALVGSSLALALALVARPAATWACLLPFTLERRERLFISWVGLRGAVPIILAAYPALRGVEGGDAIFHVVFFVVLVTSVVPGATAAALGSRLGLARPVAKMPTATIELVSLREYSREFIWYAVDRASAVAGAPVRDLPLPEGCILTMILRGPDVIAPRGHTRVEVGDHVCVFVAAEDRKLIDLLFGAAEDAAGRS